VSKTPVFYIAQNGDDSADGLSPSKAWATMQNANARLPADGSMLLFRRGDTFYGELSLPRGCEVGAYGDGDQPVLTMVKLLHRDECWIEHSVGIWKVDLSNPTTHGGYTRSADCNIGHLMIDGTVYASRRSTLADLVLPWDFYCDEFDSCLYVKAPTNPAKIASSIAAAPNGESGRILSCNVGHNVISGLHLTGAGGCGIGGTGTSIWIHSCLIDFIGGAELQDGSKRRYGNGIENWINASDWLIENNEISEVYDVAWSAQGRDLTGGKVSWESLTVRSNYIHDCGQMFEFWGETRNVASRGYVQVRIEDNICERSGGGAFSKIRPDQDVRVHLLTYTLQCPVDILIRNNRFDRSFGAYSYHSSKLPPGFKSMNNLIRLRAGTRMQHQRMETVEKAQDWQSATGLEVGSTFVVLS
jgi:hypothetical protein